jgi:PEP-CTERM motif
MYAPAQRTKHRTTLGLLTVATLLHSNISNAQLTPADHGAAVIDRAGLMWANTVGVNLTWDPAGEAGTAQAWVANLNATDYGGYSDWTLPTEDLNLPASTSTNQLGELLYTDCGNTVGKQTVLTIPTKNCRALSALRTAIQLGTNGFAGDILISSGTLLGTDAGVYVWAVYDTSNSSLRAWSGDTSYAGVVGRGDVLAVRFAGVKPKESSITHGVGPRSVPEPDTFALLAMGAIGLGLRQRRYRASVTP